MSMFPLPPLSRVTQALRVPHHTDPALPLAALRVLFTLVPVNAIAFLHDS